jgi:hypothetical protein
MMASWRLIADRRGARTPSRRPAVSEQVRTSVSVALLTSVAVLGVMLSACDGERAGVPPAPSVASRDLPPDAEPATQARPACVPRGESHARICALAPPRRRVDEGTAYKLDRYCHDFSGCEVTVVDRVAVPSGVMTRWDDASGTIRDLDVTTVDLGQWTLVMMEPDATRAERISRALRWSVHQDRYPRVVSTERGVPVDVDWAGVSVWVPGLEARDEHHLIEIVPGCGLSTMQPDLGGSDRSTRSGAPRAGHRRRRAVVRRRPLLGRRQLRRAATARDPPREPHDRSFLDHAVAALARLKGHGALWTAGSVGGSRLDRAE